MSTQQHFEAHYASAEKMVALGSPLLLHLSSLNQSAAFDLVVLDGQEERGVGAEVSGGGGWGGGSSGGGEGGGGSNPRSGE